MNRITARDLRIGLITGAVLIVAWFAVTRTTLLLSYGHTSGQLTLSQAQGLCDSALGMFARGMSAQGAARCASVDTYSMWASIAGFTGLALAVTCGALLLYRAQHQPAAGDGPGANRLAG